MELAFKVITAPGEHDNDILAFIKDNDNDFYPPIAARKDLGVFVAGVYTDDGKYILCYDNDKIVGLTTILYHHFMFLTYYHYVAIDRNYRHKGIGTRLYKMVTEMCNEHGAQWAVVKTWSKNSISQAMFRKHGFYHALTIEDDRSRGVHSYLFIRSFSKIRFQRPVKCLCVAGSGVSVASFTRTLFAVTKDTPEGKGALPFVIVSDPAVSSDTQKASFEEVIASLGSHFMFIDLALYAGERVNEINADAEIPDMLAIVKNVFTYNDKKWLLAGCDTKRQNAIWSMDNVVVPDDTDKQRLWEIVADIAGGYVLPSYYKDELAEMTLANNCQGLLLAYPELHGVFGFERVFNGIQIFDPLLELAIIIQSNRA